MRTDWTVFPAIDLRGGRVVRLKQGDPGQETRYSDDPFSVAWRWQEAGATWLHVVNLDGAFGKQGQENRVALERILSTGLQVQFGGGLRSIQEVRQAIDMGVGRVVVGTAAVKSLAFIENLLAAFGPERVVVGIDARDGRACTHGWMKTATVTALEVGQRWAAAGGRWAVFTNIARDGMGSGLDVQATAALARVTGLQVIASGGVRCLKDVERACEAGLGGVIIGRALYEGDVVLSEALGVGE